MPENQQVFQTLRPYLPEMVLRTKYSGQFSPSIEILEGALMFADISGFTAISEKLSKTGKSGSEELTTVINRHLSKMVSIIISCGGDILKFGGDAALVYFKDAESSAKAAFDVNNWAVANGLVKTSAGTFELSLHTGLHYGRFFSAEIGDPDKKLEHIVTGDAINEVFNAADYAEGGEVGATKEFINKIPEKVKKGASDGQYFLIEPVGDIKSSKAGFTAPNPEITDIELLNKFLPQGLRDKISTGRGGWVSGEHRLVSVMFVNYHIPGDDYLERSGELKERLDRYYRMVNESISSMGGIITRVDCYSKGDKILAVFGALKAHQDDDIRAAKAAELMNAGLDKINNETGWNICHKIGINGGRAFCGDVGGVERREYTVMGDDVNLAARLMSKADENKILLGEKTFKKLDSTVKAISVGEVEVKGKSMPIKIYEVVTGGVEQTDTAMEALSAHSGPMVGRKEELRSIEKAIDGSLSGKFHPLIIEGEAGIGKSRLTAEFIKYAEKNNLQGFAGACQSYGGSIPFLPLKNLFKNILDVYQDSDDRSITKEIAKFAKLEGWEPVLNDILELGIEETPETKALDNKIRQQRLFDLLYAILSYHSKKAPYYIILEDIHWIDETSQEFINYIFENDPISGLLLLCVTRPDQKIESSIVFSKAEVVKLQALPPEDAVELITSMLDIKEAPESLKKLVIDRSQGNPFFTGEIVRSLVDSGYISKDESTGEMNFSGNINDIELPDNINSLVLSRIDRLPEATRDVIKTASVVGRSFTMDLLIEIFPYKTDRTSLLSHLERLSSLDLTPIDRKGSNPGYVFKHIVTQEVAYNFQSFKEREILHQKVGFVLEYKYKDNLHPHLEILAHHFSRSQSKDKAFHYLVKAADKAFSIYANNETIRFLNEAQLLFDRPGRLPKFISHDKIYHVFRKRGSVNLRIGNYEKAIEDFTQINGKLKRWKRVELIPDVLNSISEARCLKGDYKGAMKAANQGLTISKNTGNDSGKASSKFSIAEIARRKGDFKTAVKEFNNAVELYKKLDNDKELISCYNSLGITYWAVGDLELASDAYNKVLKSNQSDSDVGRRAKILNNLGLIYLDTGKFREALENFHKATEAFERIGDKRNYSYCLGNIGYINKNLADYSEAEKAFKEALSVLEKIGDTAGTAYTYSNLGDLYYQMYKPEQAFPNHNKALEMAHELGDEELIGELLSSLAFDNLASGDIDKAYKLAKDAYDISKRIGVRIYMIKALNALVEIYLERQDNELDTCVAKLLESAKDDFSEYGSNAHYLIGKYYQSKNNPLQAKGFFSSALERAIKGGFKKLEWESRFMLGQLMTSSPEEKEFFSLGMKELETAVEIVSSTASTLTSEENASDFLKIPQIKEILEFKSRT